MTSLHAGRPDPQMPLFDDCDRFESIFERILSQFDEGSMNVDAYAAILAEAAEIERSNIHLWRIADPFRRVSLPYLDPLQLGELCATKKSTHFVIANDLCVPICANIETLEHIIDLRIPHLIHQRVGKTTLFTLNLNGLGMNPFARIGGVTILHIANDVLRTRVLAPFEHCGRASRHPLRALVVDSGSKNGAFYGHVYWPNLIMRRSHITAARVLIKERLRDALGVVPAWFESSFAVHVPRTLRMIGCDTVNRLGVAERRVVRFEAFATPSGDRELSSPLGGAFLLRQTRLALEATYTPLAMLL
jgi:hypothetical protein